MKVAKLIWRLTILATVAWFMNGVCILATFAPVFLGVCPWLVWAVILLQALSVTSLLVFGRELAPLAFGLFLFGLLPMLQTSAESWHLLVPHLVRVICWLGMIFVLRRAFAPRQAAAEIFQ